MKCLHWEDVDWEESTLDPSETLMICTPVEWLIVMCMYVHLTKCIIKTLALYSVTLHFRVNKQAGLPAVTK